LQEVTDWRLEQLKLTQEQTETHSEMSGDLFETAFSEGIFWSSIIAGGESWCMEGARSQRHNDKAQILRNIGLLFRKSSLCSAATIKVINCSFGVVLKEFFPQV